MPNMDDFVLYILMRKDMDSLNHTGKAIAQGAHAANHAAESIGKNEFGPEAMMQFAAWQKSTPQGFGTTIVLGGRLHRYAPSDTLGITLTIDHIRNVVEGARSHGIPAAIITDPSYPLQDGSTSHAFPCETCGWVFGSKEKLNALLWPFLLHPAAPSWNS